jgi:methyltransferase (TIGR00027 family)
MSLIKTPVIQRSSSPHVGGPTQIPVVMAKRVAEVRAREQFVAWRARIFHDPLAIAVAAGLGSPAGCRVLAWLQRWYRRWSLAGLDEFLCVRARVGDDLVCTAATEEGIEQVVLLGAGFDTLALRVGPALRVFEVDHPGTQAAKLAVLRRVGLGASAAGRVRPVACNFETDDLAARLVASGFDPGRPSVFLWSGVSYYLTAEAASATVAQVAELSAWGSYLLFDYLTPPAVDGTSPDRTARCARRRARRAGEPFRFGLDPEHTGDWLASLGFELVDQSTPDEIVSGLTSGGRRSIRYALIATARRSAGVGRLGRH